MPNELMVSCTPRHILSGGSPIPAIVRIISARRTLPRPPASAVEDRVRSFDESAYARACWRYDTDKPTPVQVVIESERMAIVDGVNYSRAD